MTDKGDTLLNKPERPGVPVMVAATSPFTTIILDEDDQLNATLEQVNSNTYDRLKICRTTLSVDGYLPTLTDKGIGVIVSYTGAFLFPRMKGITKSEVIDSTNRVILRLMFGGIRFNSVAPEDVGFGTVYESGYYMAGSGASGRNFSFLVELQHQAASNFETIKLIEPRTFTKKEFQAAIHEGTPIANKLPEINASIFLDGITHYQQFRLSSALVFLWTTIETLIGKIWLEKIAPKGNSIFKRGSFIESNAWHSAHKAEVLFQTNLINDALYGRLNQARSARNVLAHRGDTPNLKVAEQALEAAFSLISLIVTDFAQEHKFSPLVNSFKQAHRPHTGPLNPQFWREIPAVPGDGKWGDTPYPRYPGIELVPLADIERRRAIPKPSSKSSGE